MSIKRHRCAGFTLVEFLIASAIGSLVLIATASLWLYSSTSFAAMVNYVDLDNQSHNTLDRMTQRIRRAQSVKKLKKNELILVDSDGLDLTFKYDNKKKTLTQTKKGQKDKDVLTECEDVGFSMYQRNPIAGSYELYTTTDEANAKVIQIQWTCSRSLFGHVAETESVRSAKVVLRKK